MAILTGGARTTVTTTDPVRIDCRPRVHCASGVGLAGDAAGRVQMEFRAADVLLGSRPIASAADALLLVTLLAAPVHVHLIAAETPAGDAEALLTLQIPIPPWPVPGAPVQERATRLFPLSPLRRACPDRLFPRDLGAEAKDMLSCLVPVPATEECERAVEALLASL